MNKNNNAESEKLIASFEDDPVGFIEVFLERELSPKQTVFIETTKNARHIIAIWSRQTGKSTVIASYILWRILYGKGVTINKEWMPEHIAIVAPIKDQIKNLYDKLRTLIDRSEFIAQFIVKMNTEIIICKNGNEAKFLSASPGSQIRGYTATCIIIDESQDITDNKYNADVLPFGATTNALVIEAGTPKTKNHFYQSMMSKMITIIKQPWFDCPFISEEYVMKQKETSPKSLWRQEYLCEFADEGILVFPSYLFEPESRDGKATGRWNLGEYEWLSRVEDLNQAKIKEIYAMQKEGAQFVAGLDLGKQNDNTEFRIFRTDIRPIRQYVGIKFELGTPYDKIAQQVGFLYKYFQPYEFNFDYTNEKGFAERLTENEVPVFHDKNKKRGAIAFTQQNKTEMINTTVVLLEKFQLQLPKEDEVLIQQFMNQQFEMSDNGKYKYFHPSNENDDALWATLLALKNVSLLTGNDVIAFVNPWEKTDIKIHGDVVNRRELMVATQNLRSRNRMRIPETNHRGRMRRNRD